MLGGEGHTHAAVCRQVLGAWDRQRRIFWGAVETALGATKTPPSYLCDVRGVDFLGL
jgi:hypothetical protein